MTNTSEPIGSVTVVVPTGVRVLIKSEAGETLALVPASDSRSVASAELPKTSHSTTASKPGDSGQQGRPSPSTPSPSCADATTQPEASSDQTTCSASACDKPSAGRRRVHGVLTELCSTHAWQLSTYGELGRVGNYRRMPEGQLCEAVACERPAVGSLGANARRYYACNSHKTKHYKRGHVEWRNSNSTLDHADARSPSGGATTPIEGGRLGPSETGRLISEQPNAISGENSASDNESGLSDVEILERYGPLVDEFTHAVRSDASYVAAIVQQSKRIRKMRQREPAFMAVSP